MKNQGFTLIELVIAMAISSLIILFLGGFLSFATETYSLSLNINDNTARFRPFIKRIEQDFKKGEIADVFYEAGKIIGFKLKKENKFIKYTYKNKNIFLDNLLLLNKEISNLEYIFYGNDKQKRTIILKDKEEIINKAVYLKIKFKIKAENKKEADFKFSTAFTF